jgi:glucosamine-6-phosphate deaminase
MGALAAAEIYATIRRLLSEREEINMIFAAAPSQNEVLASLLTYPDIPWERINAFHMDEYIGLDPKAPQCFSNFLCEHIFDKKPFKSVNLINAGAASAEVECERYAALLRKYPVDIVCMGIGENGHIAFNDPHVADFSDSAHVKAVKLDDVCRMQQVNDGCFEKLSDVPEYAMTVTVPGLMAAKYNFCVVPAPTKANAVKNTVFGEVGEWCPATALRIKDGATLYCDMDSAKYIV